jgi:hypothetical protein
MTETNTPLWLAVVVVPFALAAGAYGVAVLNEGIGAVLAGRRGEWRAMVMRPVRRAALMLVQQRLSTARPDRIGWALAPAAYLGLAAAAVSVIPISHLRL